METKDDKKEIQLKSKIKRKLPRTKIKQKIKKKKLNDTESTFSCDKCVKTYSRKYELKKHLLKHSDGNSTDEDEDASGTNEVACPLADFQPFFV